MGVQIIETECSDYITQITAHIKPSLKNTKKMGPSEAKKSLLEVPGNAEMPKARKNASHKWSQHK